MSFPPFPQMLLKERARLPLWLPVLFGCGILLYFSLPAEPSLRFTGAFLMLPLGLWALARSYSRALMFLMLGIFIAATGFATAHYRTLHSRAPIIKDDLGTIWVRGVVENIEEQEHGARIFLKELDLWQPELKKFPAEETPYRARITVRTNMEGVQPGDHVGFRAELSPPPQFPAYPGGYDFARWAYFQRIGAVGFTFSDIEVRERSDHQTIHRIRRIATERILAAFGPDTSAGGIAASLLTGDRGAIDKDTLKAIYVSGLGHLLSISGLHLAMVMAGIFFFLRAGLALFPYVALRHNIKKWSACVALVLGFGYLLLAGWPVPAQRSYIMAGLFFLAILADRTGGPLRPVAWAALIVLVLTPESILSPSFQMSFAAVIALIAGFDAIRIFRRNRMEPLSPAKRVTLYILGLALSSILAGMATAPYAVYHFGRYSNYGLLANLLAIPLTSFIIMPFGMLSLVLMPLGLEGLALTPMHWGINGLVKISTAIAGLEHANIMLPHVDAWVIGAFSLGGVWLALWKTRLRLLGLPLMLASLLGIFFPPPTPDIFVGEEGKIFAVKDAHGQLVFPSLRSGKYARAQWLEYVAQEKAIHMRDSDALTCDDRACHYGDAVFLKDPATFDALCTDAAIFINLAGDAPCPSAKLSITRHDLTTKGTHLVWLTSSLRVADAASSQGKRWWTAPR